MRRMVCAVGALSLLLAVSSWLVTDGSFTLAAYAQNQGGNNLGGNNPGGNNQGGNNYVAVPEPSTLILFGTGVVGLGGLILRRRNRRK
jgi:PEP-CTERM motif